MAEHRFGSFWVYVICQIMARERLQLTSWNLASEKYTLLLSLQKIRWLDFPIDLHTAYYNQSRIWKLFDQILTGF